MGLDKATARSDEALEVIAEEARSAGLDLG
jgi:hypothetical protein